MAEIDIGVLQSQCLDRRLDNADWLRSEIGAWEERRNQRQVKIHWGFTIAVARHKRVCWSKGGHSGSDITIREA